MNPNAWSGQDGAGSDAWGGQENWHWQGMASVGRAGNGQPSLSALSPGQFDALAEEEPKDADQVLDNAPWRAAVKAHEVPLQEFIVPLSKRQLRRAQDKDKGKARKDEK